MLEAVPDVMSVVDICSVLQIGRTKAYRLINSGQIPSVKVGNSIRIPKKMLLDYIFQMSYTGSEVDKRRCSEGGIDESNG